MKRPPDTRGSSAARLTSFGLLAVALLLAVGLALLGWMNRRSMDEVSARALEGQALETGLSTAAALMTFRPRGPGRLQAATQVLVDENIRSVAVISRQGRVLASSVAEERGQRLRDSAPLEQLRGGKSLHLVRPVQGGARPTYEVWILLRPGLRGRRRGGQRRWEHWRRMQGEADGVAPGAGPPPMAGHRRDGTGPWKGRPPWGRAFLRLTVRVADRGIAGARGDARLTQLVTLGAAGLLLVFAVLLFVADRRATRLRAQMERQRALATMGEMAAVLAHEIRNPLGVIKGHAQLLEDKVSGAARERLALVVAQSGRLERLVSALLDYARPTPPRPVAVEAHAVLDQACEVVAPEALQREVALIRDVEPATVQADPDQLLQVLLNLLRNALQASPDGARITLRQRLRSGRLIVEVLDSGGGLPSGAGTDIFEPFVTTRPEGTGLGLAISRRIAEAHGGTLTGENGPEGGARFVLTLPVRGPEGGADP